RHHLVSTHSRNGTLWNVSGRAYSGLMFAVRMTLAHILATGRWRGRAAGRLTLRLGASLPDAAGAHNSGRVLVGTDGLTSMTKQKVAIALIGAMSRMKSKFNLS